jgi:hypothetical protein
VTELRNPRPPVVPDAVFAFRGGAVGVGENARQRASRAIFDDGQRCRFSLQVFNSPFWPGGSANHAKQVALRILAF